MEAMKHIAKMSNKVAPVVIDIDTQEQSADAQVSAGNVDDEGREKWTKKAEFIMSCIGYAVGLGNVWRFPYLCYANGGAVFLIPYFLTLVTCGIPLFYLELAIGQYFSRGPVEAWGAVCPLMKGLGVAMVIISFLISTYYNVVIAWSLLYLYHSLGTEVAWKYCNNPWNTPFCHFIGRGVNSTFNCSAVGLPFNCSANLTTPSEEFWFRYILQKSDGIGSPGGIRLQIAIALLIAWVVVYLCVLKGIKTSGKVAYFTACFPYIILVNLLIQVSGLPGAYEGIMFYLSPDFSRLLDPQVWIDAASQIFFSLSVCLGGLITFGSYNQFHNNCERDAIVVSMINCLTSFFGGFVIFSMLGFMANTQGKHVSTVVSSGPGLGFVAYPEGIAQMPMSPLWASLFFFMLSVLGLGSQFVYSETIMSSIMDRYKNLRPYRSYILLVICACSCILGFTCITEGGIYVFKLFDSQSGGVSLVCVCIVETLVIGWGYGVDRFCEDIKSMIGKKPNLYFRICWKYITPMVSVVIFVWNIVQWGGISYNGYIYPLWGNILGWSMAFSSILAIPTVAVYQLSHPNGSFRQRLKRAVCPDSAALDAVAQRHNLKTDRILESVTVSSDPPVDSNV